MKMNKENLTKALAELDSAMKLLIAEYNAIPNENHTDVDVIVLTDVIGSVADAQGQLKDLTK